MKTMQTLILTLPEMCGIFIQAKLKPEHRSLTFSLMNKRSMQIIIDMCLVQVDQIKGSQRHPRVGSN